MNRTADLIAALNPDVTIIRGKRASHLKVFKAGRLVGILPLRMKKEGLAENTRTAFRRAGIRLPEGKGT